MANRVASVLRRAVATAASGLSDRELLRRYAAENDQAAFALLANRHAGLVFGVCRRSLPTLQDAEDACQATFLVLARKAKSTRWRPSVANWLFTTARRVARNARVVARRRTRHEANAAVPRAVEPADELTARELLAALDEELARLAPIYREPLVLCYLEGLTRDEAALRLGVPAGTVKIRLERGRKRLGDALVRRGVVAGVGLLTLAVTSPAWAAPSRMIDAVLSAAAGDVSAPVAALAEGLAVSKSVWPAAALAFVVTLGIGVGVVRSPAGQPPAKPQAAADPKAAPAQPQAAVTGRAFAPDGTPLAGARLLLLGQGDAAVELGRSDADGRFTVQAPAGEKSAHLAAVADGVGIDFVGLGDMAAGTAVELRTVKDRAIRGRVVDTQGKPLAGAAVTVRHVGVYANGSVDSFLAAWPNEKYTPHMPEGVKNLWREQAAFAPAVTTDGDGRFVVAGAGDERFVILSVAAAGMADAEVFVVNRGGFDPRPHNEARAAPWRKMQSPWEMVHWTLVGPEPVVVMEAEKPIRDTDTGEPRPGVVVRFGCLGRPRALGAQTAVTDGAGRYELRGTHKTKQYAAEVKTDVTAGYVGSATLAADTPAFTPLVVDVAVKRGVVVTGRVTDEATGQPLHSRVIADILAGNPFAKDYPSTDHMSYNPVSSTDPNGRYRIVTVPGPVLLMVGADTSRLPADVPRDVVYELSYLDADHPEYALPGFRGYRRFAGAGTGAVRDEYCKVLNIPKGMAEVTHDVALRRAKGVPVTVVDADGKRVPGVRVYGLMANPSLPSQRSETGAGNVYHLRVGYRRSLVAYEPTRKLVGSLDLTGGETGPLTVKVVRGGVVTGRALAEDGTPLVGYRVRILYYDTNSPISDELAAAFAPVVTDATGAFRVENVLPGRKPVALFRGKSGYATYPQEPTPVALTDVTRPLDLGDIRVRPPD
ncbi:MAG: sigma-70 family RNA polymerase sigma factor [Gemmataceae bacterium]